MNPEIEKEIKDQIASLPEKVRDIIASTDITGEIIKLKEKYHLMLDQISTLEIETMLVMIGLEPAEDFVDNLQANLKIDEEKAVNIANDINELIFKEIRHAMMEQDTGEEKKETLNKDSILWEIENPTPTNQTIKPAVKIEEKPEEATKIQSNIPEIAPTQVLQKYTAPIATKNIVEQKLTEPTHIAPKEIEVSLTKLPQKTPIDPYKEAI
ncbi:MAG: hypothetical protein WCJ74_02455 [bacterium]